MNLKKHNVEFIIGNIIFEDIEADTPEEAIYKCIYRLWDLTEFTSIAKNVQTDHFEVFKYNMLPVSLKLLDKVDKKIKTSPPIRNGEKVKTIPEIVAEESKKRHKKK